MTYCCHITHDKLIPSNAKEITNMENTKFCQSCAMPLTQAEDYATNKDGSKNEDYCQYCYKDGAFTADCSMDEMIEFCVPHMAGANTGLTEAQARTQMQEFFPKLKRWS